MFISFKELSAEQKKPLDYKINSALNAIAEGFSASVSRAALAFSGGKDSTALWHLIRENFPAEASKMAVIFGNTGVEYPESLKFARRLGREWAGDNFYEARPERLTRDELKYEAQRQVLDYLVAAGQVGKILKADGKLKTTRTLEKACPPDMREKFEREGLIWKAGTIKSYWWCADQYGYPIMGKAVSKLKARRINIDCFLRFSETSSDSEELKQYYDILRSAKISQACCDILKKEPQERIQKDLKVDVIFKGLMAAESQQRKINFSTRGYLFKSSRKYLSTPFCHCNPLSIWNDNDIWEYIRRYDVPYSELYELKYKNKKDEWRTIKRNGCTGCFTDFGRDTNHMYVLRQTHPGLWRAVMKYGMAKEIQNIKILRKDYEKSNSLLIDPSKITGDEWDFHMNAAFEYRPCAFD